MTDPRIPEGLGPRRRRILEVALAELDRGIVEKPRRSNRGERIDVYVPAWARRNAAPPWCAFFCCWVLIEALGKVPTGQRRGGCATLMRDARRTGLWRPKHEAQPTPGDLFLMDTDGSRGSKGHVGFVLGVSKDARTISTIEGNSDDAVVLGRRELSDLRIVGYVDTVRAEPSAAFSRGIPEGAKAVGKAATR